MDELVGNCKSQVGKWDHSEVGGERLPHEGGMPRLSETEVCSEEEGTLETCSFVFLFTKLHWAGGWVLGIEERSFRVEWK